VLDEIEPLRIARGWSKADLARVAGVALSLAGHKRRRRRWGFRRETIGCVAAALGSERLKNLAESDVYWDRVVSIEPAGVEDTYDLTVEGDHNFVADGLIVHNSHSAAYALVAYQCAWLKAHHPAEFMAATMTSEMSDSARIVTLIEEARRMGLEIRPPDVNRSDWRFIIEDQAIRFGLGAVRNVGQSAVEAIVAARRGERAPKEDAATPAATSVGPFSDLFDLATRIDARAINRRVLESLIMAGACDSLGGERGALFAGAARALEHAASLQRERESRQSSLFGGGDDGAVAVVAPPLPETPEWTGRERSLKEKEVLGFYFSEHPLTPLKDEIERLATHRVADALQLEDGAEGRLVGVVSEIKPIVTKAGRRMAIVTLEDLSGRIECTVFPDAYDAAAAKLQLEQIVALSGRIEIRDDRGTKFLVSEVLLLEDARRQYRSSLHLELRSEHLSLPWLHDVDAVLSEHPGEADVYLHIVMPDHSRKASRSKRYRVAEDERLVATLRERFPFVRVAWRKGTP
jgi:DNA polymerase-3 subunit alpha